MKKKIPLAILEALQPIANSSLEFIHPVKDEEAMFHLADNDEKSTFYFKVLQQEPKNGQVLYYLERKPLSGQFVEARAEWQPLDVVIRMLNTWIEVIRNYNSIHTVYDDPIITAYQKSFFEEYKIVDEDALFAPFNYKQQLYIEEYLTKSKSTLENLKQNKSEETKAELEELKTDAQKIKVDLPKKSKHQVMTKLTKFWAKAQKTGLDVYQRTTRSFSKKIYRLK